MSGRDRRRSERLAASLAVTVHVGGGGRVVRGVSQDLSRSGIFVQLTEAIPEGSRVDLFIETSDQPISVSGVVVHFLKGYGIGVRFTHSSPATQERIAAAVEQLKLPACSTG